MASFESYEATFLQVTAGINTRISELGTYTSDYDAAMGAIKKLETDLKEAKQSVDAMNLCIASFPPSARPAYQGKVKQYRAVLSAAATDLESAKKTALVGTGRTSGDVAVNITASASARGKVMATTERMSQSNQLLGGALGSLAEAEAAGGEILTELDRNRETLVGIQGKVTHVTQSTSIARKIVGQMSHKEVRIKLFMAFFILLVLGLIIVMIYFLTKKSSTTP